MTAAAPPFLLLLFREYGLSRGLAEHIWSTRHRPASYYDLNDPDARWALRQVTEHMLDSLRREDAEGRCPCGATWKPYRQEEDT